MSLKLISINVERSKHLDRVLPFLKAEGADVVCVQELMERDIPAFEEATGARCIYSPGMRHDREGEKGIEGIAMFSRFQVRSHVERFYLGSADDIRIYDFSSAEAKRSSQNFKVLLCEVESGGVVFKIATTHFTWTPDGLPTDYQREDLETMLRILQNEGDFVLCGDFNAPRGGEIFSKIAETYTDNIPSHYEWSIDTDLHRAGDGQIQQNAKKAGLPGFMVDGLFTTRRYRATNVELRSGVSDHMAVVADIDRVQ